MPFANALANVVSADVFASFAALASIVALTWATLMCAMRETSAGRLDTRRRFLSCRNRPG
jgi:hypothetical protein